MASFAWLRAYSCLNVVGGTCQCMNILRRCWDGCCRSTPSRLFCIPIFPDFSWDSGEPLWVFLFFVNKFVLFIVAGKVVEGDPRQLVDFLVVSRNIELLIDYFLCFFEEIDGFFELHWFRKEVRYLRYDNPVLLSSSNIFYTFSLEKLCYYAIL